MHDMPHGKLQRRSGEQDVKGASLLRMMENRYVTRGSRLSRTQCVERKFIRRPRFEPATVQGLEDEIDPGRPSCYGDIFRSQCN